VLTGDAIAGHNLRVGPTSVHLNIIQTSRSSSHGGSLFSATATDSKGTIQTDADLSFHGIQQHDRVKQINLNRHLRKGVHMYKPKRNTF
jgi:hypothetical protein